MKKAYKTRWAIFDALFGILFLTATIWASIDYTLVTILNPVVMILFGCTFIYSKMFKDESYIATGFYWVSQNVITLGKYSHIIIGLFIMLLGFLSAVMPGNERIAEDEALWRMLVNSPSFWIAIVAVLVLNGLVGAYNYRLRNRQNKVEDNKG